MSIHAEITRVITNLVASHANAIWDTEGPIVRRILTTASPAYVRTTARAWMASTNIRVFALQTTKGIYVKRFSVSTLTYISHKYITCKKKNHNCIVSIISTRFLLCFLGCSTW